jgi:hypothetical protein
LQCNDLPDHASLWANTDQDVAATCLALEDMSGISVALFHGKIEAIHVHRRNLDSSFIYQRTHSYVTWMYCPISSEETLVGMWLVNHRDGLVAYADGLVVSNPNVAAAQF